MPIKRNYTVGIMDETMISKINTVISEYADITMQSSSHMYFDKQPINVNEVVQDVTFFQLKCEDESSFKIKLNKLIESLDELNTDYVIMDEESEKLIVTVDHGGYIIAKFDNVKFLKPGTYDKIDEIKCMKTDMGYCKGFKPKFRPLCGKPIDEVRVNPEIIYIVSDSDENLKKFRDFVTKELLELEPDFELEFGLIEPQDF
jgi:hypothetical protein